MDENLGEHQPLVEKRGEFVEADTEGEGLAKYVPILYWLPRYDVKNDLAGDLLCALTVGSIMVPQVMAYAMIAHLPPEQGLYGAIIPPLFYALFGSSHHLSVGPVSVICVMLEFMLSGRDDPASDSALLAILTGIVLVILSVLNAGFMENALSRPVLTGFICAIAVVITVEQLDSLLGLPDMPPGSYLSKLKFFFTHLGQVHYITCALAFSSLIVLSIFTYLSRSHPQILWLKGGAFFVSIFGIIVVYAQRLDEEGVEILGDIPNSFPTPKLPAITAEKLESLIAPACTLAIVGFIESLTVAKAVAIKCEYTLNANKELMGLGAANVAGGFFQCFPSFGALSRTPVMEMAGGKTLVAGIFCSIFVACVAGFMMSAFFYLPKAVMSAIVVVAVCSLIDPIEMMFLWRTSKRDFGVMAATFLATFFVGIVEGIAFALVLSIGIILHSAMKPTYTIVSAQTNQPLGNGDQPPQSTTATNLSQTPAIVRSLASRGALVFRFEHHLYFVNVNVAKAAVRAEVMKCGYHVRLVVLDMTFVTDLDASALHMLEELASELRQHKTDICLYRLRPHLREALRVGGIEEIFGEQRFLSDLQQATDLLATPTE